MQEHFGASKKNQKTEKNIYKTNKGILMRVLKKSVHNIPLNKYYEINII